MSNKPVLTREQLINQYKAKVKEKMDLEKKKEDGK